MNISTPESKETIQNLPSTSILGKTQSIIQDIKEDSSSVNKKEELLSLFEKATEILSPKKEPEKKVSTWTRLRYRIIRKKWVFSAIAPATPYTLKFVDIITETLKRSDS